MASLVGGLMEDGVSFCVFSSLLFSSPNAMGAERLVGGERHTAERHVDGGDVCG